MQRRMALSIALSLTIVVVFALLVVGSTSGLFGRGSAETEPVAAEASADEVGAALQYLAAIAPPPAAAAEPVTEYVYIDEPADPPVVTYVTGSAQPGQTAPTSAQPVPVATKVPTEPADEATMAPAPTQAAPTAVTSPVAAPTTPPPPTPTRAASSGPMGEDEFTGTATAVSGETVTFAHGGETTVVRVPSSVGHVTVGETVKVHAILLSSGWLAKEIERTD